jgi:hypothetical protein
MPRGNMVGQRTETTKRRLEMYNQRPKRDEDGKVLFEAYQSKDKSHQARIQPDRRWFGPTRTVQQHELTQFRDELEKQRKDPNVYILKQAKLPMSLLRDPVKVWLLYLYSLGSSACAKSFNFWIRSFVRELLFAPSLSFPSRPICHMIIMACYFVSRHFNCSVYSPKPDCFRVHCRDFNRVYIRCYDSDISLTFTLLCEFVGGSRESFGRRNI